MIVLKLRHAVLHTHCEHTLVLDFPCVCPEPVSANDRIQNLMQKRRKNGKRCRTARVEIDDRFLAVVDVASGHQADIGVVGGRSNAQRSGEYPAALCSGLAAAMAFELESPRATQPMGVSSGAGLDDSVAARIDELRRAPPAFASLGNLRELRLRCFHVGGNPLKRTWEIQPILAFLLGRLLILLLLKLRLRGTRQVRGSVSHASGHARPVLRGCRC